MNKTNLQSDTRSRAVVFVVGLAMVGGGVCWAVNPAVALICVGAIVCLDASRGART